MSGSVMREAMRTLDDVARVGAAVALALSCPTCMADPGMACAGRKAGRSGPPHRARLFRAVRALPGATMDLKAKMEEAP